jgi:predicted glycosyltransferase
MDLGGGGDEPAKRIMFYAHDGQGLGHSRRNLAIARALVDLDPRASVLLASSIEHSLLSDPTLSIDVLRLPGIHKHSGNGYGARRLHLDDDEVFALRAELLAAAVRSFRPDVLVVDRHPLGIMRELEPALEDHRSRGGQALLGLRDILDEPARVRTEWNEAGTDSAIAEYYEHVLVYGCRDILDPIREYSIPDAAASRIRFCGYVLDGRPTPRAADGGGNEVVADRPTVLATAGGGEDGFPVLEAFLDAAHGARWNALAVAGPHCPPDRFDALQSHGRSAGVQVIRAARDLPELFEAADAVVCMGGYNTLVESLASGAATVCVPRVQPRTEQLIRARVFQERKLLRMVPPNSVSSVTMGDSIAEALEEARAVPRADRMRRARRVLDLDGATRAARSVAEAA